MTLAVDMFAESNPAFAAFVAIGFCRSYLDIAGAPPSIALFYLAVPIAVSDDLQNTFSSTNASTGLLAWLTRYPEVRFGLGARLDAALPIVSGGIQLALLSKALRLEPGGSLRLGTDVPGKGVVEKLPPQPKQVLRRAERLGNWMAKAGTAAAIYSAFGVTP